MRSHRNYCINKLNLLFEFDRLWQWKFLTLLARKCLTFSICALKSPIDACHMQLQFQLRRPQKGWNVVLIFVNFSPPANPLAIKFKTRDLSSTLIDCIPRMVINLFLISCWLNLSLVDILMFALSIIVNSLTTLFLQRRHKNAAWQNRLKWKGTGEATRSYLPYENTFILIADNFWFCESFCVEIGRKFRQASKPIPIWVHKSVIAMECAMESRWWRHFRIIADHQKLENGKKWNELVYRFSLWLLPKMRKACTRGTRFSTVDLMTVFVPTVLHSRYC